MTENSATAILTLERFYDKIKCMSFECPKFEIKIESEPRPEITVESDYDVFIPNEFRENPFGYFESEGKNIKSGEIKIDEQRKDS